MLLLHGGPGATSDYFTVFDSFLPAQGMEYYYYDQLGSGRSDHPDGDDLWTTDRFVSEVEQVRAAIGGNKGNFCVLGQSWGGILAIEYALAHQDQLKCLVISGQYDTMDPAHMAAMAKQLPHGELLATKGSHMAMYDDQQAYFMGLLAFPRKQAN